MGQSTLNVSGWPVKMEMLVPILSCLLCCVLFSSEQTVAVLTLPRVLFGIALLFWNALRALCMAKKDTCAVEAMGHAAGSRQPDAHAKNGCETPVSLSDYHALLCEIKCLNETIANLSSQQTLLREIRVGILRSVRFTRDVLGRLDDSPCSRGSGQSVEMARKRLRGGSLSESCISVPDAVFDRCV